MMSRIAEAAVFLSGVAWLSILLKATLFLALGLTAAWLARRERASVRHLLVAATFAVLLALPFLVFLGPVVPVEIPTAARDGALPASPAAVAPAPVPAPAAANTPTNTRSRAATPAVWSRLALGAWLGGAALLLASAAFDVWRIRRLVRNGLPWVELQRRVDSLATDGGVRRSVSLLRHEDAAAPFVCGVWRPAIVLPSAAVSWSDADLDRALVHELEHVRRKDWAVQAAARVTCAFYWCHPLVWVAWGRLCLEAERACDDAVVQRAERADYAEQLVTMAQSMSRASAPPVLGMANRGDLAARIAALLDSTQRRGRAGAVAFASALCAAVVTGAAVAPVRAVGAPAGQSPGEGPGRLDVALFGAASDGDIDAITRLLGAGARVNAAISGDGSPLIAAARAGHVDAVRLLLDNRADPDLGVAGDGSPLIMAAGEGHLDVVALLLDRGAAIDKAVVGDGNALIKAAGEGHLDVVTLLLHRGAAIDHVVPCDENALIQASGSGHLDVVKLLVSRGADVHARVWAPRYPAGGEWRTPLSVARKNGRTAVVEFLQSAGAVE